KISASLSGICRFFSARTISLLRDPNSPKPIASATASLAQYSREECPGPGTREDFTRKSNTHGTATDTPRFAGTGSDPLQKFTHHDTLLNGVRSNLNKSSTLN